MSQPATCLGKDRRGDGFHRTHVVAVEIDIRQRPIERRDGKALTGENRTQRVVISEMGGNGDHRAARAVGRCRYFVSRTGDRAVLHMADELLARIDFGQHAAGIVGHRAAQAINFGLVHLGENQGEIVSDALVEAAERSDYPRGQPPDGRDAPAIGQHLRHREDGAQRDIGSPGSRPASLCDHVNPPGLDDAPQQRGFRGARHKSRPRRLQAHRLPSLGRGFPRRERHPRSWRRSARHS
jgi:hypothetical protein